MSRSGFGVLLFLLAASAAGADDWTLGGSSRIEFLLFRDPPPGLEGVAEDGATNVDAWFDVRAYRGGWEGSFRLRAHQASGIADETARAEIDRRHVAYRRSGLEVLAGNSYTTIGNGLILRNLEQRFVSLNRMDRAFNLDRNLDGVRVRGERGPARVTLLSGIPRRTEISDVGGAATRSADDLIQGGEGVFTLPGGALELGFGYVLADLEASGGKRDIDDLVSYRARGLSGDVSLEVEYAEKRPRDLRSRGIARYARLEASRGPLGVSVEGKSYRSFTFEHNQLPTLVRTHESVLLNRATHVLIPEDERGMQVEAVLSPALFTTFLVNLAFSGDSEGSRNREFREVYLEGRTEREGLGAGRLGLDWSRDRIEGVDDRWTAALELEAFLPRERSVVLDLEVQRTASAFLDDVTRGLVQVGFSRAGSWTASLTVEHADDPAQDRETWVFGSLDLRISQQHDLTLGYGSRPAGTICSGGFCFPSPAFEGAEVRLMSRF